MKAPFPWFGGKRKVAHIVWDRLGDVGNYCEPFAGSLAVLLGRPTKPKIETVNDLNAYLSNFWRALQREPEAVAQHVDWPVNEVDLEARHKWLVEVNRKREFVQRMKNDPDYYDVKMAGWWVWGISQWIGAGWCSGEWHGPDSAENTSPGINVRDEERGGKLPHLGPGRGVHRKRPHLGGAGRGVHRKLPHLGDAGRGVHRRSLDDLSDYFAALADRLRRVRVCCGDWSRICGPSPTYKLGMTGVFCMHPLTPIRMADESVLSVSSVTPGMRVHGGRNIKSVMRREHNGELLRLKLQGMPDDLRVTAQHRILRIAKRPPNSRQDIRSNQDRWSKREMVPASSIEIGDIVLVPLGGETKPVEWEWSDHLMKRGTRQLQTTFSPTSGIFRLLGYYAAEGCIAWRYGRPGAVQFTFNRDEKDTLVKDVIELCRQIFCITPTIRLHNPGAINLHVGSTSVADFFSRYIPGHSLSKRLNPTLMTAPMADQKDLLVGWLRGDGGVYHSSRGRSKLTATSASDGLARDMMALALRVGLRPSYKIRRQNRGKEFVCSDIWFSSKDAASLGWSISGIKDRCSRRIINDHMLIHVRGISRESYSGLVYDLDVDGDDMIVAGGILIHNCDPPYGADAERCKEIYSAEDLSVAAKVREWAIEAGNNPLMRIALCGYEGEHEMPADWECVAWKAHGGYAMIHEGKGSQGRTNKYRERIWFSPACLKPTLFPMQELQRCDREIAEAKEALLAGQPDAAGLALALKDWSAERRLIEDETS